jgi:hypothetical protein
VASCGENGITWEVTQPSSSKSSATLGQEHGYFPIGPSSDSPHRWIGLDGSIPPDLAFLATELSSRGIEALRAVLNHQRLWVILDVEVPLRMQGSAAPDATMA